MKLLVGLGNPGDEYARHRHNVGFMAVDALASDHRFAPWKKRFQGYACDGEIDGERALLLKPATYMNESGRAVGEAMRFLKLDVADLIVFHDELDIEPGRVKVKLGGGSAGHNGLKSITQCVGNEYVRVRIGIGHPGHKDAVSGYVLHDFSKAERGWLDPLLGDMSKAATHLMAGKPELFASDVARGGAQAAPDKPAKVASAAKTGHPAGERAGKRENAIAENLRKWMAAKNGDREP